jgi:hypothetical protein
MISSNAAALSHVKLLALRAMVEAGGSVAPGGAALRGSVVPGGAALPVPPAAAASASPRPPQADCTARSWTLDGRRDALARLEAVFGLARVARLAPLLDHLDAMLRASCGGRG